MKTTVEHQAGGCRLCSVSLEDESTQVAYLLCPDCQHLARAARDLLEALKNVLPYAEAFDPFEYGRFGEPTQEADIQQAQALIDKVRSLLPEERREN